MKLRLQYESLSDRFASLWLDLLWVRLPTFSRPVSPIHLSTYDLPLA